MDESFVRVNELLKGQVVKEVRFKPHEGGEPGEYDAMQIIFECGISWLIRNADYTKPSRLTFEDEAEMLPELDFEVEGKEDRYEVTRREPEADHDNSDDV